jgi:hypothetical protein
MNTPTKPAPPATPAEARLAHLFRAFLHEGRIHPLYLPVLNHRARHPAP